MYCGDETGSFVADIGSSVSRFGYGGDDSPKYVVPSYTTTTTTTTATSSTATATASSGSSNEAAVKKVCVPPRSSYKFPGNPNTTIVRHPLEAAATTTNTSNNNSNHSSSIDAALHYRTPLTDPNAFLSQGQAIRDWDSYEELWQNAFQAMHVTDKYKHTTGGREIMPVHQHNTPLTSSQLLRTSPAAAAVLDTPCPHPILAVSSGFTDWYNNGNSDYSPAVQKQWQRKEMVQMAEFFFETLGAPAAFVAPSPMLAAFSAGRQTALVVDVGAGGTRVTPVVDGLLLKQAQRRNGRGGDYLAHVAWRGLLEQHRPPLLLRPRYQQHASWLATTATTTTTTTASNNVVVDEQRQRQQTHGRGIFHRWAMQDFITEVHTACPHVKLDVGAGATADNVRVPFSKPPAAAAAAAAAAATRDSIGKSDNDDDDDNEDNDDAMEVDEDETNMDATTPTTTPPRGTSSTGAAADKMYELPDGTWIDLNTTVGQDLCRLPELLFSEQVPFAADRASLSSWNNSHHHQGTLSNSGLSQLVRESLLAVGDVDVRKDLAANVLLVGGASTFPGLEARLSRELSAVCAGASGSLLVKPKVLCPKFAVERTAAAWIGGSVLTSLGNFQQLWLSRTEYDEYGAALAVQRFP